MKKLQFPACADCGMVLDSPMEYHPYAACLMYKQSRDRKSVIENLKSVIEVGIRHEKNSDILSASPFGIIVADVLLGSEPDLDAKIDPAYAATWGMKKQACEAEARAMWESSRYKVSDNPFTIHTWPNIWWRNEFLASEGASKNIKED